MPDNKDKHENRLRDIYSPVRTWTPKQSYVLRTPKQSYVLNVTLFIVKRLNSSTSRIGSEY